MASIKPITELVIPNEYVFFAIVPFVGNVEVFFFSSSGDIPYDHCDVYTGQTSSLLCFTAHPVNVPTVHNYKVSNGENTTVVQALNYENAKDVISGEQSHPYSIYLYLNSVNVTSTTAEDVGVEDVTHTFKNTPFQRCDTESWGPLTFYDVQSGYEISKLRVVLSFSGTAHVIRMDMNSTEIKNPTSRAGNTAARSLRGILKTINEWAIVSLEPFNNVELPAIKAQVFLDGIGLTENVINDIAIGAPDMRVAQYLQGNTVAYSDFVENYTVPNSLQNILRSVFRYRSLCGAAAHHPYFSGLGIDDSFLANETSNAEKLMLDFFIKNGINPDEVNESNVSEKIKAIVKNNSEVSRVKFMELYEAWNAYQ